MSVMVWKSFERVFRQVYIPLCSIKTAHVFLSGKSLVQTTIVPLQFVQALAPSV